MSKTEIADFPDATLAYEIRNAEAAATPILMIMGWTGVKEDWSSLADELSRRHPVLVYDNRGMGESSIPPGPYTIEMLTTDAIRMLDRAGWKTAHVVGISMGGMVAQHLAVEAPERIERLVLGCTSHGGLNALSPDAAVMESIQIAGASQNPRDIVRATLRINFTEAWIAADPERFERMIDRSMGFRRSRRGTMFQLGALIAHDIEGELHRIGHETLIIHGTEDRLLPFGNAALVAKHIRRARLHALEGAGHLFWEMDDGESARVILDFFGETRSA